LGIAAHGAARTAPATGSAAAPRAIMTAVLLIPPAAIARRIAWLGAAIAARRPGPDPLLVALLDGAAPFATDLARAIPVPVELCFRRASSYRGTASTGTVHLEPAPACAGRAVILIDDILAAPWPPRRRHWRPPAPPRC
jgi:hypoxanthine-guanine phosphoribosyltransferase